MGAVGGSIFHFIKGTYNSPNGARIAGGMQAVRMNAPRIGGSFAVWGGLFSAFSCTVGGYILALIEGIGLLVNRVGQAARTQQNLPPVVDDPNLVTAIAAGGGGFQGSGDFQRLSHTPLSAAEVARLTYDEKVEEAKKRHSNGGDLESLDTDPIPWFAYK
ncbi:unnamed protein product [Alopecurus aequalis]